MSQIRVIEDRHRNIALFASHHWASTFFIITESVMTSSLPLLPFPVLNTPLAFFDVTFFAAVTVKMTFREDKFPYLWWFLTNCDN